MVSIQPRISTLLSAVSATTTSFGFPVENAGRLSLMVYASGVSSGNGVFTVQVSNDGINYAPYNRLVSNVTNTNAQTDVKVASVTVSSNSTAFVFFPPGDTFQYIRINVVRTTDGSYTAIAYIN